MPEAGSLMGCPEEAGPEGQAAAAACAPSRRVPSAEFYRALVDNAGDILTILDLNAVILYQSPVGAKVLGSTPEEIIGQPIEKYIHPDDLDRVTRSFLDCVAKPGSEVVEKLRLAHQDGSWRHVEARGRNLFHDPTIAGILYASRDVTETYQLECQLREAEQLARFGNWRWVKGEPAPQWSRGVARILGLNEDQLPAGGDWYEHLVHPDDRDELLSRFLDAFETQEQINCVTRFRSGQGDYRYIKTYAYAEADAFSEIGALVGLAEDVHEEIEADEALKASEAKYRLMTEQASDIVAHYDANANVIFISPAAKIILGRAPEEFIGQSMSEDHVHPADFARARDAFVQCTLRGETVQVDYRFRHRDGHYIWLETTLRGAVDGDGKCTNEVIGVTRDISERKRYEMELLDARERAEAASRTKSRFLANMSHELRTPLNAIIGFSEILQMQMFGEIGHPRYAEYAQLINESGALLLDLISDILDMSKIEAGKYELHTEQLDAGNLIEACVRLMRGRAEEQNIQLNKKIHCEAGSAIIADERAVKQILLNLLSNSIKFTPAEGVITVEAIASDEDIYFTVIDTGRGIPADQIDRLGQPFEQIATDAALAKEGTGLGLALVRSLAELHGGSMMIESEVGQGTKVTITLPKVPSCAVKDIPAPSDMAAENAPKRAAN